MNSINISEIANFLLEKYYGKNLIINNVTSLDEISENSLAFSKSTNINNITTESLILVPIDFEYNFNSKYSVIKVKNPRLSFAKVVNNFFLKKNNKTIHSSTIIGSNCNIEASVTIGMNCVIGNNVKIGKNTVLNNNIVINDNTIIGNNCYIKSGSIIGEDGFGFDFEEDGTPVRIPHIGSVLIGNNVEIGSNTVIARGTLKNTIIANSVKMDDLVFVAHNCKIGTNTVLIALAEISGSVIIGKNCWIGPNCSIIQKVKIGDNVTIGIGATVTKSIDSNKKIMGFESLELRPLLKVKKRINYGK
jgi:UDP-3-O-[3-hydroxymyristoyl] glucosamine N-acyltransferase